eukprot:231592-Amphidinium_carterae.1
MVKNILISVRTGTAFTFCVPGNGAGHDMGVPILQARFKLWHLRFTRRDAFLSSTDSKVPSRSKRSTLVTACQQSV